MNEIKQAFQPSAENTREETDRLVAEIRTLSDLELALAGGGDQLPGWP